MNIHGCFVSGTIKAFVTITALMACLLQAGCSTAYTVKGTITTSDNKRLQLSKEDQNHFLEPGATSIDFVPAPMIFPFLTLRNPRAEFKTPLSRSNYGYNGFAIGHGESGLLYDIAGQWREIELHTYKEDGTESCYGYGYCAKTVTVERCSDHDEDDCDCESHTESVYGYYPDCPGTQSVERTIRLFKYDVKLQFTDPQVPTAVRATFEGETDSTTRILATVPTSECQ